MDEVCPEFLKALAVVGLSWLKRPYNVAWISAVVPLDWQNRAVVPIFEKGDRRTSDEAVTWSCHIELLPYSPCL